MKRKDISCKNEFLLSICIPTFNNCDRLISLVKAILSYDNTDIEVVVLDNASTDDTMDMLDMIKDSRLIVYRNELNIGPIMNSMKVLTLGKGSYKFFITDKDTLNMKNFECLLNLFKLETDISCGYCVLDSTNDFNFSRYKKGESSLLHIGYLSKHPSGYFFKKDFLNKLNITEWFSNSTNVGVFPFEFICAELSLLGDIVIIDLDLVKTESREITRKVKSFTYSQKNNNLYFLPENRLQQLKRYYRHLNNLPIERRIKKYSALRIFYRELLNATFVYKQVMSDESICEHYGVSTKSISKLQLFEVYVKFIKSILNLRITDGLLQTDKLFVIFGFHIILIIKFLKKYLI